MSSLLRAALVLLVGFTLLTGALYPMVVTAIAQVVFGDKANGSLVFVAGKTMGSALIGQPFSDERYVWSRPSATAPVAYNAAASTGSNYGPSNPALHEAVKARVEAARRDNVTASVPVDLVTASASGLDPHISPAAAYFQAARVANARNVSKQAVERIIQESIEDRRWGILGEPVVNVLKLNLRLDDRLPVTPTKGA